jgi:hypothetical protein
MYAHTAVSPEILDLLVQAINQRLAKANMPLAEVAEYNRGTPGWSWTFLWQSRLKVADVRMHADGQALRINFLYLGQGKDADNWVRLLHHADDLPWNAAIDFMGELGQLERWHPVLLSLARQCVNTVYGD